MGITSHGIAVGFLSHCNLHIDAPTRRLLQSERSALMGILIPARTFRLLLPVIDVAGHAITHMS